MAIWDRNDNRGGMGGRGRNLADRAGEALRHGMDRMQNRGGYDRMDYDAGGWNGDSYGAGGGRPMGNAYDRDFNGGAGRDLGYGYGAGDRDEMGRGSMSYDRGFGMGGGGRTNRGYDRGFRGGHDTDNGDPFGDRQQQTPFRVMRGRGATGRGGGYDSGFAFGAPGMERTDINRGDRGNRLSSDRLDRQDESYRAYQEYNGYSRGLNYEPYYNAGDQNPYDANYRNRRDRDWF